MNLTSPQHLTSKRPRLLTVLDIGSTKVTCIIARLRPTSDVKYLHGRTHKMEVLGFGVQQSHGIKSGVVVDMAAAEQSIRLAVDAAERRSGLVVESLIVNFSSGRIKSLTTFGSVHLGGREVRLRDIRGALAVASRTAFDLDRPIVHSMPVSFTLDGEKGMSYPVGMVGEDLGVDVHVLTADSVALRNLELCVNRAHLSVETMVATPLASGLAVLSDDEARLGAACIDLGGGTTTFSVFAEGRFVHADAIAIGGNNVTLDIARGFSTPPEAAERLKVMYGSSLSNSSDDSHMITIEPISGEYQDTQYPRALLTRIVRARVEETLELVRDRLNRSGYGHIIGKRVVLTGGGCQLTGIAETARRILGRNVRCGRPLGVSGLPEIGRTAAFSASVGLLIYPQSTGFEEQSVYASQAEPFLHQAGPLRRVGQWLRESF